MAEAESVPAAIIRLSNEEGRPPGDRTDSTSSWTEKWGGRSGQEDHKSLGRLGRRYWLGGFSVHGKAARKRDQWLHWHDCSLAVNLKMLVRAAGIEPAQAFRPYGF